jgi:Pentapeptide repeats (8 copies)
LKKLVILPTAIFTGILLIALVYKLPQWQIEATPFPPTGKERIEAENNTRDILIKLFGGIFFIATAGLSWRNLQISEDKQVTERFSKAVEQLSSDKIEVRLGGIYSLERIAKDSPKDHWVIMEVLSAFVREKSPTYASPPIDIKAAVTAIVRRNMSQAPQGQQLDLTRSKLNGMNLDGVNLVGANLSYIKLAGSSLMSADFSGADLNYANLCDANLSRAKLIQANLTTARLCRANLTAADLYDTNLSETDLSEANFDNANLNKATLLEVRNVLTDQIQQAKRWKFAIYDMPIQKELGLLPTEPEID